MLVPLNHKRKRAVDNRLVGLGVGPLERARRQQRVVVRVERDGLELLPVAHERLFGQYLVEREAALRVLIRVPSQSSLRSPERDTK